MLALNYILGVTEIRTIVSAKKGRKWETQDGKNLRFYFDIETESRKSGLTSIYLLGKGRIGRLDSSVEYDGYVIGYHALFGSKSKQMAMKSFMKQISKELVNEYNSSTYDTKDELIEIEQD